MRHAICPSVAVLAREDGVYVKLEWRDLAAWQRDELELYEVSAKIVDVGADVPLTHPSVGIAIERLVGAVLDWERCDTPS